MLFLRVKPPKVINGILPKNKFGNYELWSPQHLPENCIHLSFSTNDCVRVCAKLNIQYMKALVGFQRKRGMVLPKYNGVIILEKDKEKFNERWEKIIQVRKKHTHMYIFLSVFLRMWGNNFPASFSFFLG